jgi:hypothetical protein
MTTEVETAHDPVAMPEEDMPRLVALMAEYKDVDSVMVAARRVRDAGYTVWDVHSPFPIHGIDKAMGIRPTILPWIVLGAGLTGLVTGIGLTVWTMTIGYPYLISGKPYNSFPAWVPVIFELTILFSALAAVFGMLMLNKLPMLYNPLLNHPRFRRVTDDRFFLVIDVQDERFDETETLRLLEATDPVVVERVED